MYSGLKILYLRPILNSYGVSKVLFHLISNLKSRGYNIFLASDNGDYFKRQLEKMGIKHYTVPLAAPKIINFLICLIKIGFIVKNQKINIIHSHHRWSSFIAFYVSKALKVPLVTTYHGIHKGKKWATLWGDKIISVSEDGKNHLINYFGLNPERIIVIHNGITIPDSEDIKPFTKGNMNIDSSTHRYIANIARLSLEKDQESLLLAMKMVLQNHPKVRLLMVGEGPLKNRLMKLAEELGIAENIKFLGEVENIRDIYREIEFIALSSLTEGLPISILEALAFGKPVVATNVGDVPLVVIDGKTGYLVPPGSRRN